MAQQHPFNRSRLEQGQALVEVTFVTAVAGVMLIVMVALAGTSMRQIFGDIQCKLKFGQAAYMDAFYDQPYCFRLTIHEDGTTTRNRAVMFGPPLISNAAPTSSVIVVEEVPNHTP